MIPVPVLSCHSLFVHSFERVFLKGTVAELVKFRCYFLVLSDVGLGWQ